ncbi:dTDP-4-dehydrorhamnose 3,5-epimerase [Dokdonella fugitiva]|uniref:dTDP-4-dehydrorhamnose 3,5-epimerase n=1 Tax=Dokdonella fugitiva TaxID=328517 RepID=A0A4V2S226_9GAMM|nr:dTDP-4-dehydrorhamnose 3,5-epimerase [Dokdonella fugitiva]MBA8884181.1 dTDP-4-dehydrorhamnose 3,5-epimerase [Dokdonella fugitiva]TCO38870.1 dTDP-4-dehydrorhamnose 3,5-epimerase [Dokdonella fugitiva]
MKIIKTELPGCVVIEPAVHGDARGYFYESFNQQRFADAGFTLQFVQSNVSRSARGVLRGLHYQWPNPQGKLVSVLEGEVYDVAVDIRVGSPTFGRWAAAILSADNKRHFWVPEGFAHGFAVLSEYATFVYQCTALYDRASDAGIRWNDAALAIDWPIAEPSLSDKDMKAPFLADVPRDRLPTYP